MAGAGTAGFSIGLEHSVTIAPALVLGDPNAVKVARYGPEPTGVKAGTNPWSPDATATVTDRRTVSSLLQDANNLPVFPSGNFSCPSNDGSHYEVQFYFANGDRRTLFADRTGCRGVGFQEAASGSNVSIAWSLTDPHLLNDLDALFH